MEQLAGRAKRELDRDVLVVRMNHCNAGFFAQVQFALNQIRWAESKKLIPVVHFGRDSVDGPNAYYEEGAGPNVWEYYFEPVGGLTLDAARELARESGRRLLTLSYWELWRLHYEEPTSVFTYPYGYYRRFDDKAAYLDAPWWAAQRAEGRRLVRRYVRVRPEIMAKVDEFVDHHFDGGVLGVHARGTDKQDTGSGSAVARIVPPAEYFPLIDRYLRANPTARVFFATDQRQFREEMQTRYGDRLLSVASTLSDSTVNAFQAQRERGAGNRAKGEEVLIDALLLSRCDFLLKCTSAVGEFAQYFSDTLESIDLNYVGLPTATPAAGPKRRARLAVVRGRARLSRTVRGAVNHRRGRVLEDAAHPTRPADLMDTNRFVPDVGVPTRPADDPSPAAEDHRCG
jgi:hypothetical protein